ncbi:MAG: hypothetical protein ACK4UN_02585 [Limisphaerales bacterium]
MDKSKSDVVYFNYPKVLRYLAFFALLAGIASFYFAFSTLPSQVVSQTGTVGKPVAWMARETYVGWIGAAAFLQAFWPQLAGILILKLRKPPRSYPWNNPGAVAYVFFQTVWYSSLTLFFHAIELYEKGRFSERILLDPAARLPLFDIHFVLYMAGCVAIFLLTVRRLSLPLGSAPCNAPNPT